MLSVFFFDKVYVMQVFHVFLLVSITQQFIVELNITALRGSNVNINTLSANPTKWSNTKAYKLVECVRPFYGVVA